MKTVRDLKRAVLTHAGMRRHFELRGAQADFWEKLNRLGSERKTKDTMECDDIDATAELSDTEYEELLAEFATM